ncbi:MAG: glutamate 5-kinase [Deferribacteraceae bacterium]|nr:glutamate 5-kinase [Deferribacteraceae bacterium]
MKKITVKVGTSTLTHNTGHMNIKRIDLLVRTLSDIKNMGIDVILVSSAAISAGVGKLGLPERPKDIRDKQAVAAVGQVALMHLYSAMFNQYGVTAAQMLLTKDVFDAGEREGNALSTLQRLLSFGVIPIINENDTISTYEIEFGDNDTLSAHVAVLSNADLLIILSDIDGLYDSDPRENPGARLISAVDGVTEEIRELAGGTGSERGTGGMVTKISAAEIAAKAGISTVIANGENPRILYDIIDNKPRGTLFKAKK